MINNKHLEKYAIITSDEKISYSDFLIKVNQYAQYFEEKKYKTIAIFSENRLEWIYAFYAGWLNNCIVLPIDSMSSANDLSYILNDCQPELVFISNESNKTITNADGKINYKFDTIILDEIKTDTQPKEIKEITYNTEDTAVIIYTSGTTGSPKGVMLSFKNLLINIKGVSEDTNIYNKDVEVLLFLPLHHIFPLVGSMIAPLFIGATTIVSPSMQSSDILETLNNNKVNIIIAVPRFFELLYKGIKSKIDSSPVTKTLYKVCAKMGNRNISKKIFKKVHEKFGGHLQFMISGGAALSPEVGNFFYSLGFDVLEGFGMTESAPMISFTRPNNIIIGSVGEALGGTQIAIKDGEIIAKGDNVMKGYYKRPKETADVLIDGWLHTGDLGRLDNDGLLWITGRKKEIIIFPNGKNLNPIEIEEKLLVNYRVIKDAAILLYEDLLTAIIQPNYDVIKELNIENIHEHLKNEVINIINDSQTPYKRIMKFHIVEDDLPRTRIGKIQRFKLDDLINNTTKTSKITSTYSNEEYLEVKSFIEKTFEKQLSPDSHLEYDLGLDSLAKLTLIDYIEKSYGVKLDFDLLIKFSTIKLLIEYIKEKKIWHKTEEVNFKSIIEGAGSIKLSKTWYTYNLLKIIARGVLRIYLKIDVKSIHNIPEGACIITPNHQSYLDWFFVTLFFNNKQLKSTYSFAKEKHLRNKIVNFFARKHNVIIMDFDTNLKESIQKMASVLQMGKKILIFPEGTRTKHGELNEFKETFAILSEVLNIPVVPVAISGAYDALPSGKIFPKIFSKINVEFHKSINCTNSSSSEFRNKVKLIIKDMLDANK